MSMVNTFELTATTQGPLYPPSEAVNEEGNFVVVGQIIRNDAISWGMALVSKESHLPAFGQTSPYTIVEELDGENEERLSEIELFSLPLPLPLNNYPMVFAPEQLPGAGEVRRPGYALNRGHIQDYRETDGRRILPAITLNNWLKAQGTLRVTLSADKSSARFDFDFKGLVPDSLYTVMSLREKDLATVSPTRPGPLGIPNVFITDANGNASYYAVLENPFPEKNAESNRIINVIVLFMSGQQSYGGAIGLFGLGGDVHAHLKLQQVTLFDSLLTELHKGK